MSYSVPWSLSRSPSFAQYMKLMVLPLENFSTLSLSLYFAIPRSSDLRMLIWLFINSGYVRLTIRILIPAYLKESSFAFVLTDQDLPPPLALSSPKSDMLCVCFQKQFLLIAWGINFQFFHWITSSFLKR